MKILVITIITIFLYHGSEAQDLTSFTNLNLQSIWQNFVNVFQENFSFFRRPRNNNLGNFGMALNVLSRAVEWISGDTRDETFDFIIVGSGSSGSVIANRLSEVSNWTVLVLEAGRSENFFSQVPLMASTLQQTQYDWQYVTEYQTGFGSGMTNNILAYPRGRALGGTSVINYMIYTRGHPDDYNRWEAEGNPGWSYREVLPYFLRSENASSLRQANPNFHSRSGNLHIEDCYQSPLAEAFLKAGEMMGSKRVDYSSADPFGYATVQATTNRGRRQSCAKAFLDPVRRRRNLEIYTSAFVTQVLINPETKHAFGVEYMRNGKMYKVLANKEVILSAGTFNSAQLLMLAGIGPRNHLQDMGIDVLEDLPVGENMQDHLAYTGLVFKINKHLSLSHRTILRPDTIRSWMNNGTGPLASTAGVEGLAFIKTSMSKDANNYPDVELVFVDGSLNSDFGLVNRKTMRIRDDVYEEVWGPLHFESTWSIFPMLLHPKSVGRMRLRSKNPFDYPLFYGNYLTDGNQEDVDTMVAAIRYVIRLSRTKPFRQYGSKLHDVAIPGCDMHDYDTDDYWRCAVKTLSTTMHHQVGTVKMGSPNDPTAVVNPELKVYGMRGLRVADCSVIPFALSAHTHAPAIMIGEKAADMIKQEWMTMP